MTMHWYFWVVFAATVYDLLIVIEALATKTLDVRHLIVTTALIVATVWLVTP